MPDKDAPKTHDEPKPETPTERRNREQREAEKEQARRDDLYHQALAAYNAPSHTERR